MLDVMRVQTGAVVKGKGDDGDDDAVEEDVGEDGHADDYYDEPGGAAVFEEGRGRGGVGVAPAEDVAGLEDGHCGGVAETNAI